MDTLHERVQASIDIGPDRVALRTEGSPLSYRELGERTDLLTAEIFPEGGAERVGLLLPNQPVFPVALLAVLRGGGSALLLNPMSSPREVSEQVRDADVKRVITTERLRPLLATSGTDILLVDGQGTLLEGDRGGTATARERHAARGSGDREAVVIFTSGMQGRTRGASLSHRNLIANVEGTIESMGIRGDDRVAAVLPFAHAFGLTVCLTTPLVVGATVLPIARFNPVTLLGQLETEGVTVLAGVPAMYIAMISAAERRGVPGHGLRVAICGGAPMSLEVGKRWEELFGMPLRQGYGLTEASPVCLFNRVDRPNVAGSMGAPFPGVEVSVRDLDGRSLGDGEVGELCVRGANVFGGFLDDPHDPAIFHGEWLRTGDLASISSGAVRFRGTIKRMFTRNGFNVYPEEIRRVLEEDPRVLSATAYARPDPIRENEIVLRVTAAEGVELTRDEVLEICRGRLAGYKQPAQIRIE